MHFVTCREAAEVDKSINKNLNNLMTIKMLAASIEEFDPFRLLNTGMYLV